MAVIIETATTIEQYLAANVEFQPAKYETLTTETENSFKFLTSLSCARPHSIEKQ